MGVKVIVPNGLEKNLLAISGAAEEAFVEIAGGIIEDFEKTTATWKVKPVFTIRKTKDGLTISTDNMIYKFLDEGTSVRYAIMSNDFIPKTAPKVIGSGPGRGGIVRIGRRPQPGIQPRMFVDKIRDKWKDEIPSIVADKISKFIKSSLA